MSFKSTVCANWHKCHFTTVWLDVAQTFATLMYIDFAAGREFLDQNGIVDENEEEMIFYDVE